MRSRSAAWNCCHDSFLIDDRRRALLAGRAVLSIARVLVQRLGLEVHDGPDGVATFAGGEDRGYLLRQE